MKFLPKKFIDLFIILKSEELSELNEFEELIEEKKKIVCVSTDN